MEGGVGYPLAGLCRGGGGGGGGPLFLLCFKATLDELYRINIRHVEMTLTLTCPTFCPQNRLNENMLMYRQKSPMECFCRNLRYRDGYIQTCCELELEI